ncbi:MAG: arginine repressor [Actinobacteria bacterium]|nr:arginine repressor [Actinomycetota bacterium]
MSRVGPVSKAARQRLLADLVERHETGSQGQLVALLRRRGVEATQATVSRDLDELGIAKVRGADGTVAYALPEPSRLSQILRQFVLDVDASGNLAVVRTLPGAAAAVASAIDQADLPDVLATVQGDDTLLVVAVEGVAGRDLAARLLTVRRGWPDAGLRPPTGPARLAPTSEETP